MKNAHRHSLTARFLITKKIVPVLSCIRIDSFFAKALAFELLRKRFLPSVVMLAPVARTTGAWMRRLANEENFFSEDFSFSEARSESMNGRRCFGEAVPSVKVEFERKQPELKEPEEIAELMDNAPIATGTSKNLNVFRWALMLICDRDLSELGAFLSLKSQKTNDCLKGTAYTEGAA